MGKIDDRSLLLVRRVEAIEEMIFPAANRDAAVLERRLQNAFPLLLPQWTLPVSTPGRRFSYRWFAHVRGVMSRGHHAEAASYVYAYVFSMRGLSVLKIGVSHEPTRRVRYSLRKECTRRFNRQIKSVRLVAMLPCVSTRRAHSLEQFIHANMDPDLLADGSEWYEDNPFGSYSMLIAVWASARELFTSEERNAA
jgi:predicted GIY-YIG superfamily endonuclease